MFVWNLINFKRCKEKRNMKNFWWWFWWFLKGRRGSIKYQIETQHDSGNLTSSSSDIYFHLNIRVKICSKIIIAVVPLRTGNGIKIISWIIKRCLNFYNILKVQMSFFLTTIIYIPYHHCCTDIHKIDNAYTYKIMMCHNIF